jgi:hypothetical protein
MDSFFVEVLNVVGQLGISLGLQAGRTGHFTLLQEKGGSGLDDHMSPVKCHA